MRHYKIWRLAYTLIYQELRKIGTTLQHKYSAWCSNKQRTDSTAQLLMQNWPIAPLLNLSCFLEFDCQLQQILCLFSLPKMRSKESMMQCYPWNVVSSVGPGHCPPSCWLLHCCLDNICFSESIQEIPSLWSHIWCFSKWQAISSEWLLPLYPHTNFYYNT